MVRNDLVSLLLVRALVTEKLNSAKRKPLAANVGGFGINLEGGVTRGLVISGDLAISRQVLVIDNNFYYLLHP